MNRRMELEGIIQSLEDEKTRLTAKINELREQLETYRGRQTYTTREDKRVAETLDLPTNKPFFFHRDINSDVGLVATTVQDLYDALDKVELESIEFHLHRRDFERWLIDVFQAYTLASQIAAVRRQESRGKQLRDELRAAVKEWLESLPTAACLT